MTSQQGGAQQPAGIRDVARLAGVSVASVSFALNGLPGVADDTRRRILAAAAELRLPRQPAGPGLAARPHHDLWPGHPQLQQSLLPRGADRGRTGGERGRATLVLLDSHYSAERERLLVREMASQRLAGLAIAPVGKGESVRLWQELRPGTPVVALNAAVEGVAGLSRVYPDNATGVGLAMRRLAELGHSCAAFLSAPRGLVADPDRLRHFRRLARELGVQPVIMRSPLTITDVRKAAGTLLARRTLPPRSSRTPTTRRSASTRPPGTCPCGSGRTSPSSDTTTCRPPNCSTRRWRPSAWTAGKWAGR